MNNQLPFPFGANHPKFRIPGWTELLGEKECINAADMARHFLITGETGSGKSASGVMRLLEGILRYPEDEQYREYAGLAGASAEPQAKLRPAVLVVDPKQELEPVVRGEARGRRVTRIAYGESTPVLHLFEGRDLDTLDAFEALDFILQQSDFYTKDMKTTREPVWNMQAASVLRDFIAVDMWLARNTEHGLVSLWQYIRDTLGEKGEYESHLPSLAYDRANYFKPHNALVNLSSGEDDRLPWAIFLDGLDKLKVPGTLKARFVSLHYLAPVTRSGVLWMVNGILQDLSSEEFTACVSVNPIEAPPKNLLSVRNALANGDAVVYVPTPTPIADIVGRCLKTKFFESAFERKNKVRPFFYVVDEAHRFLSSGAQDGEQSLLDRCRAFRTGVVLATQSIASIAYRLGSSGESKCALQIILNNCGNAMYFRTSDIQTQENVEQRIPGPPVPGRPHVIKIRPLTSLTVGQCYTLRCDGTWGLFKIHLAA